MLIITFQYKAEVVSEFGKNALQHFQSGTLNFEARAVVVMVLPLEHTAEAHAIMESNANIKLARLCSRFHL